MHQQLVADEPAIDEQVDRVAIQLLNLRPRNEPTDGENPVSRFVILACAGQCQDALAVSQVDQIVEGLPAENLVHTIADVCDGSDGQQSSARHDVVRSSYRDERGCSA